MFKQSINTQRNALDELVLFPIPLPTLLVMTCNPSIIRAVGCRCSLVSSDERDGFHYHYRRLFHFHHKPTNQTQTRSRTDQSANG